MSQGALSTVQKEEPVKSIQGRVGLVLILFLTLLVAYLDRVNVSVLLADPTFLTDMGIKGQPVQMGLLMTSFLIAYGFSNVLTGPIGDWLGPRKAMSISILLWVVAVSFGGVATTFSIMILSRVILGIGEGMHWPMQSTFVKNWFPPQERGKANSVWLLGLMIGPAVAMPLFTAFVSGFGWRLSFWGLALLGLIPLVLIWFFTADHPKDSKHISKEELEYLNRELDKEAKEEQNSCKDSLKDRIKIFILDYRFWSLTLCYFAIACEFWGIMAWLPSYLKVARGFSWTQMGAFSSLPYILGAVSVLLFGHYSDKLGRRAPFLMLSQFATALFIYLGAIVSDNFASAILISFGIAAVACGLPAAWSLLQKIVPANTVGAGAGVMNGVSNGCSAFSPVLIGFFISVTGSYFGGLMFLVGIGVVGGLSMLALTLKKY